MAGSFGTLPLLGSWSGVGVYLSIEQIRDGGFEEQRPLSPPLLFRQDGKEGAAGGKLGQFVLPERLFFSVGLKPTSSASRICHTGDTSLRRKESPCAVFLFR